MSPMRNTVARLAGRWSRIGRDNSFYIIGRGVIGWGMLGFATLAIGGIALATLRLALTGALLRPH